MECLLMNRKENLWTLRKLTSVIAIFLMWMIHLLRVHLTPGNISMSPWLILENELRKTLFFVKNQFWLQNNMHNFSASPSQSIGITNGIGIWHSKVSTSKEIDYTISSMFILTNQLRMSCCVVESEIWSSFRGRMASWWPMFSCGCIGTEEGEKNGRFYLYNLHKILFIQPTTYFLLKVRGGSCLQSF